jgi:hypothetical protein
VKSPFQAGFTMFDRCVVSHQETLEIGRRYFQALGPDQAVGAILQDLTEGRLSWNRAQQVLSHVHHLVVEHIARRVGFTRFEALYKDVEFVTLRAETLANIFRRHGPHAHERYARAAEGFAWTSLRLWHLVAHDLGGRHVYEATPELARLARQRLPGVSFKSPRLPVSALLLLVPREAELTLKLKGFPAREVTEIYAVEAPAPGRSWALWVHAPIDERIAESVYLELPFPPEGTLEQGLARAHDMFQDASPAVEGWRECVRWFAAVMCCLSEGARAGESQPPPPMGGGAQSRHGGFVKPETGD